MPCHQTGYLHIQKQPVNQNQYQLPTLWKTIITLEESCSASFLRYPLLCCGQRPPQAQALTYCRTVCDIIKSHSQRRECSLITAAVSRPAAGVLGGSELGGVVNRLRDRLWGGGPCSFHLTHIITTSSPGKHSNLRSGDSNYAAALDYVCTQ